MFFSSHLADDNTIASIPLFFFHPWHVPCESACANITRENVKWCVRIADMDRNIETCVSLNGTQEVFESTCEAESLDLKKHLHVRSCNIMYMYVLYMYFLCFFTVR